METDPNKNSPRSKVPSRLWTPPSTKLDPPVKTRAQELPFDKLSWPDFERLCLRLVSREADVEHCQLYGTPGQEQEGIDLYARRTLQVKYDVYQCKRVKDFGPAKIKGAVQTFRVGGWADRTDRLTLCTEQSFEATQRADEFEKQRESLKDDKGVDLVSWDSRQLSFKLKTLPELIDDFFGREWVREFCGGQEAEKLGERLDSVLLADLRRELGKFYSIVFNVQDTGIPVGDTHAFSLPLDQRYVIPDVMERRNLLIGGGSQAKPDAMADVAKESLLAESRREKRSPDLDEVSSMTVEGRLSIDEWIADNSTSVILGAPGSGKSSLLRFLAIDLLKDDPRLMLTAERWGRHLPVWVPFPLWTKLIAESTASTSLTDMLKRWLGDWSAGHLAPLIEKALRDKRLLLLVDGLDEWTNETAAGIALDKLRVFIQDRNVPAVLVGRPRGFKKLGISDPAWRVTELADLSVPQQRELARLWFAQRIIRSSGNSADRAEAYRRSGIDAHEFVAELARSPDFQALSRIPLLLGILIFQRMHDGHLPTDRFKAYADLVDHLTIHHPRKRKRAAMDAAVSLGRLTEDETKRVLGCLAFYIHESHPDGLIEHAEAESVVRTHLKNDAEGLGLSDREATIVARELLEIGVDSTGILVSRSHNEIGFFHRSVQEHLAGCYLAELPLDNQIEMLTARCIDPQWSEILLNMFHLTRRPGELNRFAEALKDVDCHQSERFGIRCLLTELAFGPFNCSSALTRTLMRETIDEIEWCSSMSQRRRLLQLVLDGGRSLKTQVSVVDELKKWLPCTLHWRSRVISSMAGWISSPELVDCLSKALYDENSDIQRSASTSLVAVAKGDKTIGDRISLYALHGDPPLSRAAAVEALARGWPTHERLEKVIATSRTSVCPELRFAAIAATVDVGRCRGEDLRELFRLSSSHRGLDWTWRESLVPIMLKGWPGSTIIKRICLDALHNDGVRKKIDREVATLALLQGFPNDDDVANFYAETIRRQKHPFPVVGFYGWKLLAENFRDHANLVSAIDDWIPRQRFAENHVAYAALVGRTPVARNALVDQLDQSSVPHWAAHSLLEGWPQDEQATEKLRAIAWGPVGQASDIAFLLPQIITDVRACRERLIALFEDPDCGRPDFVLQGLEALGIEADTEESDRIFAAFAGRGDWQTHPLYAPRSHIISILRSDARSRELAIAELEDREGDHGTVARLFKDDPEIRARILRHANPLASELRGDIARSLRVADAQGDPILGLLSDYELEKDPSVKTELAIRYYESLHNLGNVNDTAIQKLLASLFARGPDFQRRRQAGFAGLLVLGRKDVYERFECPKESGEKPSLLGYVLQTHDNPTFTRCLLKHWERMKEMCHDSPLGIGPNWESFWDEACVQADEFAVAREEAAEYFSISTNVKPSVNILTFLARARPRSHALLHYCFRALHIGEPQLETDGIEAITAGKILGSQFRNNKEVYEQIIGDFKGGLPYLKHLIALCEAWPESPILDQIYSERSTYQGRVSMSVGVRLMCIKATSENLVDAILKFVRHPRNWGYHAIVIEPLTKRLAADSVTKGALSEMLLGKPSPSEKASFARLLSLASGLGPEVRPWVISEIDRQTAGPRLSEIGFDFVCARFDPSGKP